MNWKEKKAWRTSLNTCCLKAPKSAKLACAEPLGSVGGGLDAYTTKEETFVYATVPNLYVERAMELLGDVMFNSTFSPHEIKKRRM